MKFKKFNYKKVNSTNDTAIRIIKQTNFNFGMVTAEIQLKGKGQYGRKWVSPKGNLFVSFFSEFNKKNLSIKNLTKMNCFLVKKLLSKYTNKEIKYKNPNDLLIEKKKICGILHEIIVKLDKKFLIIGIGININKSPNIKNYPTTNLQELAKKRINKIQIQNKLKQIFEKNLSKLYKRN